MGYLQKSSMHRLQVVYNDALRLVLRMLRWTRRSEMFASVRVSNLQAILKNVISKCICSLNSSENMIVLHLTNTCLSAIYYQSNIWKHLYNYFIIICIFYF